MAKRGDVMRKKLVAGVVAGKTQRQAALDAGYAPKWADSQASAILKSPQVLAEYQKALRKLKITPDVVAGKIKEHLDAKKTISVVSGKDAGAGTCDFIDVPDYGTQQKAIEQIFTIDQVKQKVEVEHSGNVNFSVESVDYSAMVKKR